LTGKCFPLTNFVNGKQIQESLKSGFSKTTYRETNMALHYILVFSTPYTCIPNLQLIN
jgi:hypothetical protein